MQLVGADVEVEGDAVVDDVAVVDGVVPDLEHALVAPVLDGHGEDAGLGRGEGGDGLVDDVGGDELMPPRSREDDGAPARAELTSGIAWRGAAGVVIETVVAAVAAAVDLVRFRTASYRVAFDDDPIRNLRVDRLLDHRRIAWGAVIAPRDMSAYDRRPGRETAQDEP
jgi:hypothetical protein